MRKMKLLYNIRHHYNLFVIKIENKIFISSTFYVKDMIIKRDVNIRMLPYVIRLRPWLQLNRVYSVMCVCYFLRRLK